MKFWRIHVAYPSSFRRLLWLGMLVVVVPLAFGLVVNALQIRQLSEEGIRAVYQAQRATQASRLLADNLMAQERSARQFLTLEDETLWKAYQDLHEGFVEQAALLHQTGLSDVQQQELLGMMAAEESLHQLLLARHDRGLGRLDRRWQNKVVERFIALSDAANSLVQQSGLAIEGEIGALRDRGTKTEQNSWLLLAVVLPTLAVLIMVLSRVLNRPIGQIEEAIEQLSQGQFERAVMVEGPKDLHQVGQSLDRLRLRLVQLEEQKSRFLRQISHELKTPLTALREGADLLSERALGDLSAHQSEVVAILKANSMRLKSLIEDLLNFSRAEFDQFALQRQIFPFDELLKSVVECQALAAKAREVSVQVDCASIVINADRERVRTVIDNLLSNAIKYSAPGSTVRLRAHTEDEQLVFLIADQGDGVDAADRARIFEPFYRGRPPVNGVVKGSGLGLSIAREHVLAHGGDLRLIEGEGARFELRLPLR